MAARDPVHRSRSARVAALHRWHPDEARDLSRDIAVERVAEAVAELVDADPPLSPDDFARLALALRGRTAA